MTPEDDDKLVEAAIYLRESVNDCINALTNLRSCLVSEGVRIQVYITMCEEFNNGKSTFIDIARIWNYVVTLLLQYNYCTIMTYCAVDACLYHLERIDAMCGNYNNLDNKFTRISPPKRDSKYHTLVYNFGRGCSYEKYGEAKWNTLITKTDDELKKIIDTVLGTTCP